MAIDDNASYELTGYQVKDLAQKIRAKADSAALASVATSGLYSDLTGAPTIPTVYNGTLTIQQNGTTVDTFTANSSADKTVNIQTITAETVAPAEQVGAITASMIDWSTMTDESSYFRLGNLLVQFGTYDFGTQSFSNDYWGNMRRSDRQDNHIVWPIEFANDPYFVGIWPSVPGQIAVSSVGGTRTQSSNFAVLAPTSYTGSAVVEGYWIAIGPAE